MEHRPPDPSATPEQKLRLRLRQLVVDWRMAETNADHHASDAYCHCADELQALLDESET